MKSLPSSPGIYLFSNKNKSVIYVGKAKNLKDRVASYFSKQLLLPKTAALVSKIKTIDYIQTATEIDALLLEASFIRCLKPHYNLDLKDDKNYPLIKITKEKIPQIKIVRKEIKDQALYFGPYPESQKILWFLRQIRKIYPYVTQSHHSDIRCFRYHLNLCPCPSTNDEIKSYQKTIKKIVKILEGSPGKPTHQPWEYDQNPNLVSDQTSLKLLNLSKLLNHPVNRIECYDISHTSGTAVVASMVVFTHGIKDSKWYRRFKIKTEQNDDVAAMTEVLTRRQNHPEWPSPDLIVIDGGLPQLSHINLPHIIGLAKKNEEIYLPSGQKIVLPKNDPGLQLLQEIRDESHRFAQAYHHLLRLKKMLE